MVDLTKHTADQSFFVFVKDVNTGKIRRIAIPSDVQIGLKDNPAELQLTGRLSLAPTDYGTTADNKGILYASNNDTIISVSMNVVPVTERITVYLPANPRNGQLHFIKDMTGTANLVPIDVVPSNNGYIDSSTSETLSTAYGSIALYWFGDRWRILVQGVGSSSGGGSADSTYIVLSNDSTLTHERRLSVSGSRLSMVDNGPNADVVLDLGTVGVGGSFTYASITVDAYGRVTAASSGTPPASTAASYITVANEGTLTAERALTMGTGLLSTDGGANSTITLRIDDNVVATVSGTKFTGPVFAFGGLTGSLQEVEPSVPYLLAGTNVTITTQSNGQIVISSVGGTTYVSGGAGADVSASFITIGNTGSLPNERALTAGYGLSLLDGGPNDSVIISFQGSLSASTGGGGADASASYVTVGNTGSLPNERALTAGSGISITDNGPGGTIVIAATGTGSGGGADVSASYVTIGNTGSLPNERALIAGYGLSLLDGGSNDSVIISFQGNLSASTGGGADVSASYITVGNTGSLPNERALTAGAGITITDGGPGAGITISTTSAAAASGSAYSGYTTASVWWSETGSWTPFLSGTLGDFTDQINNNVSRSGSDFTVQDAGNYFFHANFNAYGNDAYVNLRLSGSNGVVLQRSTYRTSPGDQSPVSLDGVFSATSGSTWRLEYVSSGTLYAWTGSNPMPGGDNMRTGEVSLFKASTTTGSVASATAGAISGSLTSGTLVRSIDLTATGTLDWFAPAGLIAQSYRGTGTGHGKVLGGWIHQTFDWKPEGSTSFTQASDWSLTSTDSDDIAGALSAYNQDQGYYTSSSTLTGIGYRFRVPGSTTTRRVTIYSSNWSCITRLTVRASDGSFSDFTLPDANSGASTNLDTLWVIDFNVASDGAEVIFMLQMVTNLAGSPNVKFAAVTLE